MIFEKFGNVGIIHSRTFQVSEERRKQQFAQNSHFDSSDIKSIYFAFFCGRRQSKTVFGKKLILTFNVTIVFVGLHQKITLFIETELQMDLFQCQH